MHVGVSKRKKNGKKVARSTKAAKKPWSFYSKHVFPTKTSSIFPGVTGNILEEYVDLIVTQDSADHFASHETIEGSKQGTTVITCFYQNFWMQDIQRAS